MPNFDIEKQYKGVVAGVDEAGLGPLAGPIVVTACIVFPENLADNLLFEINDSKKLTKNKREYLFNIVTKSSDFLFGTAIIPSETVDNVGLSAAWKLGITEAVANLNCQPNICLIDGNRSVILDSIQTYSIIKGDQKSISIASASIVAKVTRDRIMQDIHKEFPEYGFNKHVGYGTKAHLEALRKFGITKYHRKSYAPIKNLIKCLYLTK